jgi:hypothetical protein
LYPHVPKRDPKGFISISQIEPTGLVAIGMGISDTPTIMDEGFKGIPLIKEGIGAEGFPMSF